MTPGEGLYEPIAVVEVAFEASNASTELHEPLGELQREQILLELESDYVFGTVSADEVPALRNGTGSIVWGVPFTEGVLDQIRSGVIRLGGATKNEVVIPLADPASTVSLNDINLDVAFTIAGHRESTLTISSARIQFGVREAQSVGGHMMLERPILPSEPALQGSSCSAAWAQQMEKTGKTSMHCSRARMGRRYRRTTSMNLFMRDLIRSRSTSISGTYEFVVIDETNGESAPQAIVVR